MTDEKLIMDQVHDYEKPVSDILAEGMKMCEVLQANVLVEKLPKSWLDYHNSLRHKKRDISLEATPSGTKRLPTSRSQASLRLMGEPSNVMFAVWRATKLTSVTGDSCEGDLESK
ncbi:hypothetical protein GQ457_17G015020 [Hibiscus cannabinus]